MKTMFSLIAWLMIPAALFGAPVVAVVLGIERQAVVARNNSLSSGDLERAASMLMRYDPAQMIAGEVTTIIAHEDELNTALSAGLAFRHPARMRVVVEASGLRFIATAELPAFANLAGRYVNIAATIAPSRRGLDIKSFRVGRINLPKPLATPAMQILLEALLGPGKGAHIIENIQSVDISGKTVAIGYRPPGRGARLALSNGRREAKPINVKLLGLGYNQLDQQAEGRQN